MKSRIFMYLFIFAILLVLFQYMNQKSIFENQEQKIEKLSMSLAEAREEIELLKENNAELNYFTLMGNDNAMTYIENLGMEADSVQNYIKEAIYEQNFRGDSNPLIQLEGTYGTFKINKIKFLNHRWILADFSDGRNWGETIIEYFYTSENEWDLTPISTVLYPN